MYNFANNARTTLDGAHNDSVTTLSVVSDDDFPTSYPFMITVYSSDPDTDADMEIMKVTASPGANQFTVARNQEGSGASAHSGGDKVMLALTAGVLDTLGQRSYTYVIGASDSRDTTGADAVCDGTADDVEIQAGIDAVNTAGGGTVMLLDGTYEIDSTVQLKSYVTLAGNGYGTILTISDATVMFEVASATTVTHATVKDLQVDGNGQSVHIYDDSGALTESTFKDLYFVDCTARQVFEMGSSSTKNNHFIGITCENCFGFIDGAVYSSLIDGLRFNLNTQVTSGGSIIDALYAGSIFTNSVINTENITGTLGLYGDDNSIPAPAFTGNTVIGIEHTGYFIVPAGSARITDNTLFALSASVWTGDAIYFDSITGSLVVANNRIFKNAATSGYCARGRSGSGAITIANNSFHGGNGVSLDISSQARGCLVQGNYIYTKGVICVNLEGPVKFHGNNVWAAGTNCRAIQLTDDIAGLSVIGNNFYAQGSDEIPIYWNANPKMSDTFSYILKDNTWEGFTALETNGSGVFEAFFEPVINGTGGASVDGQVVIRSYDSTNNRMEFNTTTTAGDSRVIGVCIEAQADNILSKVVKRGPVDNLKVNGTDDIAEGDPLSCYTDAGIAQKATAGETVFAIALEAYTTDDSNGTIDAILIEPYLMAA